ARELLGVKLPAWRSSCCDPSTLPPSAIALLSSIMVGGVTPAVSTATVGGPGGGAGGGNDGDDDDDSTAPPSPTPSATLAAATAAVATAVGAVATVAKATPAEAASVAGGDDDTSVIDLVTRAEGSEVKVDEGPPAVVVATETAPPPAPPATSTPKQAVVQEASATQRPMSDVYSHTMPSRKMMADRPSILPECRVRSGSVRQVKRGDRPRVFALFPHSAPTAAGGVASDAAVGVASEVAGGVAMGEGAGPAGGGGGGGGDQALLSFEEGDVVTLLVPEAKGGWHYGEHERTHKRGWFPFAYTQLIVPGTVPVAVGGGSAYALNTEPASPGDKPRPYSIAVSGDFNIDKGINGFNSSSAFLRGANPFASVKLRPTKTNDRSAPAIK
ncbi:BAR/IMD domain-containing adapter protein 2-like, partial [Lampetra fluviatilis]